MFLHEARSLLGVSPMAEADAVRRAYLRLLRVHKPESDPEGFQRLREAYELVRAVQVSASEGEDEGPLIIAPSPRPAPPRVATLTQDVSDRPGLQPPGPDATDEELLEWLDLGPSDAWVQLTLQFLDRGREDLAVDTLLVALGRAGAPPVGLSAERFVPFVPLLASRGCRRSARLVWSALVASLGDLEEGWAHGVGTEYWHNISQLVYLPPEFPDELHVVLAAALLEGNLRQALGPMRKLQIVEPTRGKLAFVTLFKNAPGLYREVHALDPPVPKARHAGSSSVGSWWLLLLPYLLFKIISGLFSQ